MEIRPAIETDAPAVARLVSGLSRFYLADGADGLPTWLLNSLTREAFAERFASPDVVSLLAESQAQLLGYLAIKRAGHVVHLFVAEAAHRQGVARRLWQAGEQQVGAAEYSVRSSIYATPVYRSFGFQDAGPVQIKDGVAFQPMRRGVSSPAGAAR